MTRPRKNASAATKASNVVPKRAAENTGGPSSAVRGELSQAYGDDVTLLYRRPRSGCRPKKHNTTGAAAAATADPTHARGATATLPATASSSTTSTAAASAATTTTPAAEVIRFFHRCTGPLCLANSLSNCAVEEVVVHAAGHTDGVSTSSCEAPSVAVVSQNEIFQCSKDRLETALQAVVDLQSLLLIFSPDCRQTETDVSATTPSSSVSRHDDDGGHLCWVRAKHWAAAVALARVCEAAIPLQLPSLITQATQHFAPSGSNSSSAGSPSKTEALYQHSGSESAAVDATKLVPSPVMPVILALRRRCLYRLWHLRETHVQLMPSLRGATSAKDLCHILFSHEEAPLYLSMAAAVGAMEAAAAGGTPLYGSDVPNGSAVVSSAGSIPWALSCLGNPLVLDTLLPTVGITARHPQEEATIRSCVEHAKQEASIDGATWGAVASTYAWKYTEGVYIVHHASRVRALRCILTEADFYGLPRFLRSIRVLRSTIPLGAPPLGSTVTANMSRHPVVAAEAVDFTQGEWYRASALRRAQALYDNHFFITPDCLDPKVFAQPDPMQTQLVQEELVTLQRNHCSFCMVIGDADEVMGLLQRHTRSVTRQWRVQVKRETNSGHQGKSEVKEEGEEEREGLRDDADASSSTGSGRSIHYHYPHQPPLLQPADRNSSHVDPLLPYVLNTVRCAKVSHSKSEASSSRPYCHSQWVHGGVPNRWVRQSSYYGLMYAVVMEDDDSDSSRWENSTLTMAEGLLPRTAIQIDNKTDTSTINQQKLPLFFINAVVELWRN